MVIGLQCLCLDELITKCPAGVPAVLVWQGASAHSVWRVFNYLYKGDYFEETAMALEGFGKFLNLQQFACH